MSILDLILLVPVVAATVVGALRGAVREIFSLLSWTLAIGAAWFFSDQAAAALARNDDPLLARIVALTLLFVGVFLAVGVSGLLLRRLFFSSAPTTAARVLGGVLGGLRGVVVAVILVWLAGLTALPQRAFWRESLLAPALESVVLRLGQWLPPEAAGRFRYAPR